MPVSDTQLLLRLSADVAKFQKQMSRITKAGENAAVGVEQRFGRSNKRMAQSAEQSGIAIGREMDRLRAKYDPLFAASKRYEALLNELNRAQKVGALNVQQYDAALENLNAEYARSTGQAQRFSAANKGVTTQTRGMGGGIQNVAFQVGDLAVQMGAGTAASVALGQQLPQLLGGFGVLGAVLGAVVAVGIPVASMLFDLGKSTEESESATKRLSDAVDDYVEASKNAHLPTEELAEKYGTATEAAREFLGALQEIADFNQLSRVNELVGELSTSFGNLSTKVRGDGLSVGGTAYEETLRSIQRELDVTGRESLRIVDALKQIDTAEGPQEALDAVQEMRALLEEILGPFNEMKAAGRELYERFSEAGIELSEMIGAGDAMSVSIGGAASEAGRLADELGRAVQNAINLAAQGVSDANRARIEYEFRDDRKGRVAALARERFDAQTDLSDSTDSTVVNEIEKQRRAFVKAAVDADEYSQKLAAYRKEEAAAAAEAARAGRRSGSSGRGGSRKKKDEPGLFEASDREMLQLERRLEMIGKTSAEMVRLEAKYALLDEAKERDLSLDKKSADSGETLLEQIDRQAAAISELSEQYSRAEDRARFLDGVNADVKDGFLDAAVAGESLSGVLEDVARSFAKAYLQAGMFGEGPMAGGNAAGGLLGGILGSFGRKSPGVESGGAIASFASGIISGRAAGGPVRAGEPVRVGEHGSEIIVPAMNGRVLSAAQSREAMQGGGGGGGGGLQKVQVEVSGGELVISDGGELMQRVRVTARSASSGAVQQYDEQVLPDRFGADGRMSDPRRRG